jgi:hypothetical protein
VIGELSKEQKFVLDGSTEAGSFTMVQKADQEF